MNVMNMEAVFVTGLVRNNTTRYSLDQKILDRYKSCCEKLLTQNKNLPSHYLYDEATICLQRLLNNPDAKIPIQKLDYVIV